MTSTFSNLKMPSHPGSLGQAGAAVPMPARRWRTRLLLPLTILTAGAGLLAYAARATFQTATDVWVLPIVSKPMSAEESATTSPEVTESQVSDPTLAIAQAPGWVEADPYAITVPALAEGVVREVLIVEGQRVETGQVLVRMVDDDAKLASGTAAAELAFEEAERERAKANLEYQQINYERLLQLHESKNAPDIEWASAKRDRDEAIAQVHSSEAKVARHRVVCEQAHLTLSRMEVRSPVAGVVMERLIEPGTRISMSNVTSGEKMGAVARLYDPKKLQVRVDVPLADAAKVEIGTRAEIATEATGDVVFHGTVSRLVHQANIQRNTVQVKVAIEDPSTTLKPEMLTRVRFFARRKAGPVSDQSTMPKHPTGLARLFGPRAALIHVANDRADMWVVEQEKSGPVAAIRHVTILGPEHDGYCPLGGEIQPGMRVILESPAGLMIGSRVRVLGEKLAPVGKQ